ncbi:MAG: hypothetical protein II836_05525, partial [Clostridia bacterium]|nr:hypothetical protein [Clostridia bacterium]
MSFKRTAAFLILAALILSLFAGCSTATTDESTVPTAQNPVAAEEAPEADPDEPVYISDDLPDTDYNGYDFRILTCYFYNKELATYITYDEITGDPVDDVLYASRDNIQNRFNIG